jgi:hypothetical protein
MPHADSLNDLLDAFGVSAEKSGDKIKFTYKSVETEVANSSSAIQAYLKKIGDTDFAFGYGRTI